MIDTLELPLGNFLDWSKTIYVPYLMVQALVEEPSVVKQHPYQELLLRKDYGIQIVDACLHDENLDISLAFSLTYRAYYWRYFCHLIADYLSPPNRFLGYSIYF